MNIFVIFSVQKDNVISKREMELSNLQERKSLIDLKNYLELNCKKMKYFDDDGDLISLTNDEDFYIFQELVLKKEFINRKVVLIAHDDILDQKKFGRLENVLNLKVEDECSNSFDHLKSVNSALNFGSLKHDLNRDSVSSTSSSSVALKKRKLNSKRKKKYKSIPRYAAEFKREVNYLTGSEVYDGQTIVKRWRIKNIGSKKWKANSVKSVLLPSTYSGWVSCTPLTVPMCFADQKVDVEMEICIHGVWDESCYDGDFQEINLTWLLFKDGLFSESTLNFKDYILTCLELRIRVKKRTNATDLQSSLTASQLQKHLSESSIERVDQDFSIVNLSEEEKVGPEDGCEVDIPLNGCQEEGCDLLIRNQDEVTGLDLPDLSQGDDFQIADFNKPGDIISVECPKKTVGDIKFDNTSGLTLFNESNYVGKIRSTLEEVVTKESIDESIAQTLVGLKVSHGNFEVPSPTTKEEKKRNRLSRSGEKDGTKDDDENLLSTITFEEMSIIKSNDQWAQRRDSEKEKHKDGEILSSSSEDEEFIECDGVGAEETLMIEDERNCAEVTSETKEEMNVDKDKEGHHNILSEIQEIADEPINNKAALDPGNISRHKLIETIRNEFPRTNEIPSSVSYYPGGPSVNNNASNTSYGNESPYTVSRGQTYPINTTPSFILPPHREIIKQSDDKIVEDLRRGGHLHGHINEVTTMQRAENGQHFVMSMNLDKLRGMGFVDEDKNRRLLAKFNNNINDVINDLID